MNNISTITKESLNIYRDYGILPGHFLTAILCNDLRNTCHYANAYNESIISEIVKFCWDILPPQSWGDPELVKKWVNHSGFEGLENRKGGNDGHGIEV